MRGLAILLVVALASACSGTTNTETWDKRYHDCIDAGGSFEKDDVDWSCTMPPKEAR